MSSRPSRIFAWRPLAAPLAIVFLALTVRVAFQRSAEAYPRLELIRNALDDQVLYEAWARSIVSGTPMDWAATGHEFAYWAARWPGVFPQDPGYPFLLALLFRALGFAYDGVRALQAALGAATALLAWSLARRHVSGPAALGCGLVAALYQPLVFYEATLLREPVATFLVTAALVVATAAAESGGRSRALLRGAAAGLLLGAAVVVRSHLVLPAAAVCAWLLASTRRRLGAGPALAMAAAAVVAIGPVVAVNVARSGRPAFISSAGPYNLFIGNVHDGAGGPSRRYLEVKAQGPAASVDLVAELGADIARHPGAFLRRQLAKTDALFGAREVPDNLSVAMGTVAASALRLAAVSDAVLMPAALVGMALGLSAWRRHALLYAFAGAYAASVVPFVVVSRLRQPLLPVLAVFAALAAERVAVTASAGRRRHAAALAAAWLALTVAMAPRGPRYRPVDFLMAGEAYARLGEIREAAGDAAGALRAYGRAAALNPGHMRAVGGAVRLRERVPVPAPDAEAAALCAQARDAAEAGGRAESLRLLDRAIRRAPEWALPYKYRANVHVLHGEAEAALADMERAVALDPADAASRRNLEALRAALLAAR